MVVKVSPHHFRRTSKRTEKGKVSILSSYIEVVDESATSPKKCSFPLRMLITSIIQRRPNWHGRPGNCRLISQKNNTN